MVTVERNGFLKIEGRLIVFPRFTMYLIQNGKSVRDKQDKVSNRYLNELMMKSMLNEEVLPDISIYNMGTKKWNDIIVNDGVKVSIDAGPYGSYVYNTDVFANPISKEQQLWMIQSYLLQYSSAKLIIK